MIGVLDNHSALSQEVQITPTYREERANRRFSEKEKPLELSCCVTDLSIISHSFQDEKLIFDLTPSPPHPSIPPLQGRIQGDKEERGGSQGEPEQGQIIFVTGVQLNPTETAIELILQTPTGSTELLEPNNISSGNNFIVEIPNSQLKLPEGQSFRQTNPIEGISEVTVTNRDSNTIRVTVIGENAAPQVELFDSDKGLIFGLTPLEGGQGAQTPPTQTPTPSFPEASGERGASQGEPEEGQIIPVTGVQLNPTETAIELILQTPTGSAELLQPSNISSGNNFIVEIPNTQLQLPDGKPFRQTNPAQGISEITVTNRDASKIRVTATGETALPQVELFDSDSGLIFSFTPVEESAQTPSTPQPEEGEGQIVSIDRVQLNPTEMGFEIVLLTPAGKAQQLRVVNVSEGNNFIAEIPNAQLKLPDDRPFRTENPIEGVSEVTVTNQNENTVRVTAVGEEKQPTVELFDSEEGLVFSAVGDAPSAQGEEDIELVVTGEQDGYFVPNSSIGTRTDTPLRDIPQSIQVIPQQVLQDQNVTNFQDALRNVAGVTPVVDFGGPIVRGFNSTVLRDGLSEQSANGYVTDFQSNIEQIEILRGPASVLYGSGEPGGVVNLAEKKPQAEPFYRLGATIGNYDTYRGTLDFTGPLNSERTILYRLNTSYENSGSFIDFVDREEFAIFPVLSFQVGSNTRLTFDGGYRTATDFVDFYGLPLEGTILPNPVGEIPRSRFLGEPDFDETNLTNWNIGYLLEHEFSEDWSIRNRFRYNYALVESQGIAYDTGELEEDNRTFNRVATSNQTTAETYTLRTDLLGQFQTGIIEHDILFGVELRRGVDDGINRNGTEIFPLDVFDPEYGNFGTDTEVTFDGGTTGDNIGIYAQNLLSIGDKVKVLLGGRFDIVFSRTEDRLFPEFSVTSDTITNFAPRIGIVYQPIEPVSLYASWSRSFDPEFGTDRERNPFVPIEGEQFEAGVKTEFLDGRLAATLAFYQITRQNDFQPDPVDPNFNIQIGEQRSRGIDFDIRGELLPGLRLIANYSYIDAEITEDTTGLQGNQVRNVPQHSGSIWAVYEIQEGNLQGLGLGAGVFVVGDRQGNSGNTFELPSYALTNALLYYRRDNWRVQLNFENLFDTDYFINSYTDSSAIPGRPFTVRGQVFVTFGGNKSDRAFT
ncbi:TonB-dependent siderophore receptor [Candidatus Gracilibacteria bacterium]|nr:TonB-dependent siderophore receptor [Candidatus Gracilibacteria bacterium]